MSGQNIFRLLACNSSKCKSRWPTLWTRPNEVRVTGSWCVALGSRIPLSHPHFSPSYCQCLARPPLGCRRRRRRRWWWWLLFIKCRRDHKIKGKFIFIALHFVSVSVSVFVCIVLYFIFYISLFLIYLRCFCVVPLQQFTSMSTRSLFNLARKFITCILLNLKDTWRHLFVFFHFSSFNL